MKSISFPIFPDRFRLPGVAYTVRLGGESPRAKLSAFTDLDSGVTSLGNTYRVLADNDLSSDRTESHRRGCVGGSYRAIHLPVGAAGPGSWSPEFFERPQR